MSLQCLQNHCLNFCDGFTQKLLTGNCKQVMVSHDFDLGRKSSRKLTAKCALRVQNMNALLMYVGVSNLNKMNTEDY